MNRFIIGLTGGIGSGKTTVSDWFNSQGIAIIDADVISHTITKKDSPVLETLKALFGDWVLDDDGNYNRTAMREYIFYHADELKKLNAAIHPAIGAEITKQLDTADSPYIILSVPLLFESYGKDTSLMHLCDHFLVVDVDETLQLTRASQRDHADITHIKNIITKQISRSDRLALAKTLKADIVQNTGNVEHLYQLLLPLHHKYLELANQKQTPSHTSHSKP